MESQDTAPTPEEGSEQTQESTTPETTAPTPAEGGDGTEEGTDATQSDEGAEKFEETRTEDRGSAGEE